MRRAARWRLLGVLLLVATAARGEPPPVEDAEMNFVFSPPPAPWVRSPTAQGDRIRLKFADVQHRIGLTLAADDTGAPADVTDEEVLARALEKFGGSRNGVEIVTLSTKERTIG